ncbi:Metallo-hydrolase/oxidoreductase [Rhizodiscina lignyota]|uniref:Metallo-hydrolase/oxidoreductase n=1 Tax=Rhizodiscina lignyota TaxID=1504668 RepID=A0A9P4I2M2_9PEZI|nr:Metallo-hydrolase/oxidoreductase [Rhizodiscina lignyota]
MAELRAAVYIAPPILFASPSGKGKGGVWSPISCTLVYAANEAVLVDTPITIKQTEELISWIKRIAPGRKLSYIYITHGHGDHFFGIPQLLKEFPEAVAVATAGTVAHMEQQIQEKEYHDTWEVRFPGQIYRPFKLADPLPSRNEFRLANRWLFRAIECGHSDTYSSTALWQPDLKLAVCGDVVYGQVHQMLGEANTKTKREEWIRAVEKIEALDPAYVVPGHCQAEEIHGAWHLTNTKKYLVDFGEVLKTAKDRRAVIEGMNKLYPDRFNPAALIMSAVRAFEVPKKARI